MNKKLKYIKFRYFSHVFIMFSINRKCVETAKNKKLDKTDGL